jgi:hypothetical protein
MATTTNYGWTTPDDTDLVKDGAAAIRTLGSSVDTTTKALNPSTTEGDLEYRSSTANTNTRLAIGTAGQVLTVNSGATAPEWALPADILSYAVFTDEKSTGTHGGTFTSGAFRTRDINTSQHNTISGASIASNQITLGAGTYLFSASCPGISINQHATRLYNITDSAVTILGSSEYTDQAINSQTRSFIQGIFTIAGTKVFEVQGQCQSTKATTGFGQATNIQTETYTIITITKI